MTPVLLVLAGLLVLPLLWSVARMPATVRLAARNVTRRRAEAALVVGGAMLGTAIITASMVTGDVIDASVSSGADNFLGPIDVRVGTQDATVLDHWQAATAALDSPEVDGLLPWVETTGSVVHGDVGDAGVNLAEVDLDAARAFGGDLDATGLAAVETLAADELVLSEPVAATLDATVGDTVTVHAFGAQADLTVAHVLPQRGLVGYAQVLTAPGTVVDLAGGAAAPGITAELLVSTTGGVRDAVAPSDALLDDLRAISGAEADPRVTVQPIKQGVLDEAEQVGTEFTTLFSSIGSFAVIAGILLLVNLFVMLAEERRRDLGTLRALGMRRNLLARTFAVEGAIYALVASVVGVALGTVVGIGVANVASSIFDIAAGGLTFSPVVEAGSLVTAGLLGFTISMATAWVLSARIARANIIRSLRELPEPPRPHRVRTLLLAVLGIVAGGALTVLGVSGDVAEAIIAGVPLALLSAVALLRRLVPAEVAMIAAGAGSVAWALVASTVWSAAFADAEMTVFVVQGVVLTAGAVMVIVAADRAWKWATDAVTARTGGIAGRLGTAYPLARRSRTGLLLGMFAIVVFTMTFIAAIDSTFAGQAEQFSADTGGDWDALVTAPASAVDAEAALADHEDVAAVARVDRTWADIVVGDDTVGWGVSTFDDRLLSVAPPPLAARSADYGDDLAVYEAVLADPSLLIVQDGFGQNGGPGGAPPAVGDQVTLASADGAGERTYEVVGVLAADMTWHGALGSEEALAGIGRPSGEQRFFLDVPGDADAVAAALDAELVTAGVDAQTFDQLVAVEVAAQSSFLRLLQVFLGLGLVIGVAGLGVVLVRAVRERTRQVGTLRAIGVRRATVARAFLVEAGFIAVQGVLVGGSLGLVSAWQVLTRTDTFGQMDLAFTIPWVPVVVIAAVPLLAALATTVAPARRAAAIRPAVALRVAD